MNNFELCNPNSSKNKFISSWMVAKMFRQKNFKGGLRHRMSDIDPRPRRNIGRILNVEEGIFNSPVFGMETVW